MCILYVFNQKRDVLIGKFTVISTLLSVNVPPGNTALAGTALLSHSLCSLLLHCADLPLRCVVSLLYSSIGKRKSWDALVEFKLLLVHTAYECMFLRLTLFKIKESLWKAYWALKSSYFTQDPYWTQNQFISLCLEFWTDVLPFTLTLL